MIRRISLRSIGTVGGRTTTKQRYPRCHIAIHDPGPPETDRSYCTEIGEAMVARQRKQLVRLLIQCCAVANKRKYHGAVRQCRPQRRRVSQPPSLCDRRLALCQCLIGKAETEKDGAEYSLRHYFETEACLMSK